MVPRLNILACAAGLGALLAATNVLGQLSSKSPFTSAPAAAAPAATQTGPLQYAGYMQTEAGIQYRLVDPARKIGAWVKLNERNADFDVVLKEHDATADTVTIEHQGRAHTLAIREAKVVSAGNAQPVMPAPVPAPAVAPAVTQSVVLNPTQADEQKRLEAVAAEVARRRALREQALQQQGNGAPGMPPANMAQPGQPPQGVPGPVQQQFQPAQTWVQPQPQPPSQNQNQNQPRRRDRQQR